MYNRYIPQPDGTYRRNRMQDTARERARPVQPQEEPVRESYTPEPEVPNCQNCVHSQPQKRPIPQRPRNHNPNSGVGNFLRNLLPRDFDTEDLIIVLLLLLMAGDCQEDQNSALLTLVLYLFM